MPLRITGMNSGLDTESIITELVKAKKTKVDKEKKAQTKLQWKQDKWKELNTKLLNLYQKTVGNMRFTSAYMKKTTVASNANAVKIVTGENAVDGVQNMTVDQLAKTGYLTGAQLSANKAYTADTKLSEIKDAAGNPAFSGSGSFSVTVGGKTTDISVNGDTKISDVVSQLKSAGLNVNFDEKNQRFFISAKKSGLDNDFSLSAVDADGFKAMQALGINASLGDDPATLKRYEEYAKYYDSATNDADRLANMKSLIDGTVAERVAAYKADNEAIAKSLSDYNDKIANLKKDSNYPTDGKTAAELKTELDAKQGRVKTIQEALDSGALTDAEKAKYEAELETVTKEVGELSKKHALVSEAEGYEAEIAKLNDRKAANDQYVSTDANGNVTANTKLTDEVNANYLAKAKQASDIMAQYNAGTLPASKATKVAGQNALVTLNGAVFESDDNVFEINGLTFTALQETKEAFTVTTQNDTEGIYDTIKNFLKEYNSIINEMDKLYNAESAKGYEPLTDEEKDELSDKEIEKWEEKIKDSIMRRDDTLSSVASGLKSVMSAGIEIDGKTMYLSDFGINTLSYFTAADNEKNAYHIDGDADDANTSGNADKLKAMISADPETVSKFFTKLSQNMYSKMSEMSSRQPGYRSYNSFFNDQKMKADYNDYTSKIADLEKKLKAYEDKWYNKFAAMETALSKIQSSESALTGLLGG